MSGNKYGFGKQGLIRVSQCMVLWNNNRGFHNVWFYGVITETILELSLNTPQLSEPLVLLIRLKYTNKGIETITRQGQSVSVVISYEIYRPVSPILRVRFCLSYAYFKWDITLSRTVS